MDTDQPTQIKSLLIGQTLPLPDTDDDPRLAVAKHPGDLSLHLHRLSIAPDAEAQWAALIDLFIASTPQQRATRHQALDEAWSTLTPERARLLRAAVATGLEPNAAIPDCASSLLADGVTQGRPLTVDPHRPAVTTASDLYLTTVAAGSDPAPSPAPAHKPSKQPTPVAGRHTWKYAAAAALVVVVAAVVILVIGRDDGDRSVAATVSSTLPATSEPASVTTSNAAVAAREASEHALATTRAVVATVLDGAPLEELRGFTENSPSIDAIAAARDAVERARMTADGAVEVRVVATELDGDRAIVKLEATYPRLRTNAPTGAPVQSPPGTLELTAQLERTSGGWKVIVLRPF